GKVVGGGFPVGIGGGKAEFMMISAPTASSDVFDSSQSKKSSAKDVLFHSGTYNGHPMILAAGLATIKVLEQEMEHVLKMTDKLRRGIDASFEDRWIPMQTIGIRSIVNLIFAAEDQARH